MVESQQADYIERLSQLELERAALRQQLDGLNRRLRHLDREYGALKGLAASTDETVGRAPVSSVVEAVYQLLRDAGTALHYKDIYRRLEANLFTIGGAAPLQNLVTQLGRDGRFHKVDRGTYGLKEWKIRMVDPEQSNTLVPAPNKDVETGARERREHVRHRLLRRLEVVDVDIKISQMNLKALRKLARGVPLKEFPEGLSPSATLRALQEKLANLLEQRQSLSERLETMEDSVTEGGQ